MLDRVAPGARSWRRRRARRPTARRRGPSDRPPGRSAVRHPGDDLVTDEHAGTRTRPRRRRRRARPRIPAGRRSSRPHRRFSAVEPHRLGPEADQTPRQAVASAGTSERRAARARLRGQQVHRGRARRTAPRTWSPVPARSPPACRPARRRPSRSTAIRSPSTSASVWSWVTWTIVPPTRACSAFSSARVSDPQLEVQIGQRLVEQEHVGLAYQRARQRDPLPLPAGELAAAAGRAGGAQPTASAARRARSRAAAVVACRARSGRTRCSPRRVRCGNSAYDWNTIDTLRRPGRSRVTSRPAMTTRPGRGRLQPGDHPQQRGLAGARTGRAPRAVRRGPTVRSMPCSTSALAVRRADAVQRQPASCVASRASARANSGRVCSSSSPDHVVEPVAPVEGVLQDAVGDVLDLGPGRDRRHPPHGRDRVEEHLGVARRLRRVEERGRLGHLDVRRHGPPGGGDDLADPRRSSRTRRTARRASLFCEPRVMQYASECRMLDRPAVARQRGDVPVERR